MKKYSVTGNCINFITLDNREEAIRLADSIQGCVFLTYPGENLIVYSYQDAE
jgi:hypothetical protein